MTDTAQVRSRVASELNRLAGVLRTGKSGAGVAGRILRAHMVVETCLRQHVQAMNPNLGPIEDLGLSFNRLRAAAVGLKVAGVAWANEELKVLNTIRNKLAHQIDAEISEEDVAVLRKDADELLRDSVFKDKLVEHGTYPAWIVEVWAMLFGTMLALEQAMERHKNDLEAQRRELDAAGAQLLHELFEAGGPASSVERTS